MRAKHRRRAQLFTALLIEAIFLTLQPLAVIAETVEIDRQSFLVRQCAEILDISSDLALYQSAKNDPRKSENLRAHLLRRMLLAYLQIRQAVNKTESELDWTYGILAREQTKQNSINQSLNAANFAQFSVLYTLEPYARMHMHFRQSAILTCIGAGLGTAIPVAGIIYNKTVKTRHTAPPRVLSSMIDGGPVDAKKLPPLVDRFLDATEFGAHLTRREQMFVLWKDRFKVSPDNVSTLCRLDDDRSKSIAALNKRILLLWSLHTFIEKFDEELAALVNQVRQSGLGNTALSTDAANSEAAIYLKISAKASEGAALLGVLSGMLEVRQAADKIDSDLNYSYDVVLANLLGRRGKSLQRNFDAHFIETGIFGGLAGLLYLKNQTKAGNEMFVISSAIGICLSTAALWQLRGGERAIDSPPNALTELFEDGSQNQKILGPVIDEYIAAHREEIIKDWKSKRVSSVTIDTTVNRRRLEGAASDLPDTIKIVRNRIALLHVFRSRIEKFDSILYDYILSIKPSSEEGRAIVAALDVRNTLDRLDDEITRETLASDKLARERDLAVTLTTNANFFQINILSIISDGPLGLSSQVTSQRAANNANTVSGIMAGGLTAAALVLQPGGFRSGSTPPNTLGAALGLSDSCGILLSPALQQFVAQHRLPLIEYWKDSKVVSADVTKTPTLEKLAACRQSHRFYNERIKLIDNRIRMLYDVKALLGMKVIDLEKSVSEKE